MRLASFLVLHFIVKLSCFSQEVVATQGETLQSSAFQIDFTLGETITETINNNINELTQGFQQSEYTFLGTTNVGSSTSYISIFPNPINEQITIINDSDTPLEISLFDISGKLVFHKICESSTSTWNVSNLAPGYYNLGVYKKNKLVQITKLCKKV